MPENRIFGFMMAFLLMLPSLGMLFTDSIALKVVAGVFQIVTIVVLTFTIAGVVEFGEQIDYIKEQLINLKSVMIARGWIHE